MNLSACVIKDDEVVGRLEIPQLERVKDLVKYLSKDVAGEEFRKIMLLEDFTRSVFSSGETVVLSVNEMAFLDDVLDWFGSLNVVFRFSRGSIAFSLNSKECGGEFDPDLFMRLGNYTGYHVIPFRFDEVVEFSRGEKRLSDILPTRRTRRVILRKEVMDSGRTLGDVFEAGILRIETFIQGKPLCVLDFPTPNLSGIALSMRFDEICLLGRRFEIETAWAKVSGSCTG